MKFSCPNCTAKYQIADDKVAGRTVKMKCRKCGTVIPLIAPSKRALEQAPEVHALSIKPSRPGPPTVPASSSGAEWHAGIGGAAKGPLSETALRKFFEEGSVSGETYVWKEGMDGWKPLSQVAELAHLLRAAPLAPGPPSMPAVVKAQGRLAPPRSAPAAPRLARHHHPGAPAKVALPKPSLPKPSAPAPLASTPLAAVPLVNDQDAVSVVENERVSVSPLAPPVKTRSKGAAAKAPPPRASSFQSASSSPARAKADPSHPAAKAAKKGEAAPVSPGPVAAPSQPEQSQPEQSQSEQSQSEQSQSEQSQSEAPVPEIAALSGDAALSGEGPYVANQRPTYESLMVRLQKKRQNPYAIPLAVVGALIFGLTLGFVFFGDQETKIIREVVEVPVQGDEAAAAQKAEAGGIPKPSNEEQTDPNPAEKQTTKVAAASPAPKVAPEASAPAQTEISKGLKGLAGLEGLGGPSSGPSTSSSAGASSPLDSSQIQSTVSKYRTSVKRGCWQPALDSRDKDAPSSARVNVAITVASSGQVTNATTSGDPAGYRGLSTCISSKVRSWQFPRSSGTTTVNVPFVFAAQ